MTVGQEHVKEVQMGLENQLGVIEGIMVKIDFVLLFHFYFYLFIYLFTIDYPEWLLKF